MKVDLKTGGKLLIMCEYTRQNKSDYQIKQLKTSLRRLRKTVIQIRANLIGKD